MGTAAASSLPRSSTSPLWTWSWTGKPAAVLRPSSSTTFRPSWLPPSSSESAARLLNARSTFFCLAPTKPAHGLLPPAHDDAVHYQRCLAQLRSKDKSIEKYIYLSQLKDADPSMFYRMCLANMAVRTVLVCFADTLKSTRAIDLKHR